LLTHLPPNCSLALAVDGDGDGVTNGSDDGTGNPLMFNTGVLLSRGDKRGLGLLRTLGSLANGEDRFSVTWEQQALHRLWREDEDARRAMTIVRPRQRMQSYLKQGDIEADAFIMHMTMCISQRKGARNKRPCVAQVPVLLNRTETAEQDWF
jgi:hypothetical protein